MFNIRASVKRRTWSVAVSQLNVLTIALLPVLIAGKEHIGNSEIYEIHVQQTVTVVRTTTNESDNNREQA